MRGHYGMGNLTVNGIVKGFALGNQRGMGWARIDSCSGNGIQATRYAHTTEFEKA